MSKENSWLHHQFDFNNSDQIKVSLMLQEENVSKAFLVILRSGIWYEMKFVAKFMFSWIKRLVKRPLKSYERKNMH